jgi:mannose-6-phosphate isomerase-like protein (cupin superfamily)
MISKETAEHYVWGNQCDGWHLVSWDQLSVIHERMPPGTFEVRHFHHHAHQFFFVLRGTATLEIDGKREILQAQQGAEVPSNCPHQLLNRLLAKV